MTTAEKTLYSNSKCSNYQRINTCVQCMQGYYFNKENDQCVACETSSNCAYCDFKDPTKCIMCKSTFFMTVQPENVCISNSVLDVEIIETVEVIPDIYIVSGIRLLSSSLFLLFVLFGDK